MKTIDVRITGSDDVVICPSVVRDALQNYFPEKYFTVTELPPPQEERSCENCGVDCSGKINSEDGDVCYKWQPAAPVAPAVETEMGMTPSTKAFLKKAGVKVKTVDDVFLKNILANSGNNPQPPCPSCEKLRAENAELKWKIAEQKQNNEQVDYKYHDRD